MMLRYLSTLALALVFAGCSRQPAPPLASTAPTAQPNAAAPSMESVGPAETPAPETAGQWSGAQPPAFTEPEAPDAHPRFAARRAVTSEAPPDYEAEEAAKPSPFNANAATAARRRTLTIPAGTKIRVRLGETLDTKNTRPGERFVAHLDQPLMVSDNVVVPRGTPFRGHVVQAKSSGRLKGRAYLGVTLDSFQLRGSTYQISTSSSTRSSTSHKKRNLLLIGGGSGTGAAIGAIAGGGVGALIGAGAGAAAGTTGALITGKKNVKLPAETPLMFSLQNPVTIRG